MKIFITGGSGLFGSKLAEIAIDEGNEVYSGYVDESSPLGTGVKYDLNDFESIKNAIENIKPTAIVHSAAMTNVDQCEENPVLAFRINALATKCISNIAKKKGIFVHYISTDYVFDGERGSYKEDDEINPIDVYGITKYIGELWMDSVGRTSMIYGARPAWGKINFAIWLINKLSAHEEVQIVEDQYISPTLNTNLARMVLEIVEKELKGVYHIAGGTRISRYDFSIKLAEVFDLDKTLVKKIKMDQLNWKAKRPKDSSLDTSKVSSILKEKPYHIEKAFQVFKEEVENASNEKSR
jgi:dTDP-4-dehydrorhamnose reductase